MQTLDEVGAVAERFENVVADSRHDQHVENDVDRVGQLNAVLCKVGADDAHGVGNDIHRLALHRAGEQLGQLCIAFSGCHPVVDVAGILLLSGADKGAVLNACNVVECGSVQVAVGEQLLIELDELTGRASLFAKLFRLRFGTVDPDDLIRLRHGSHFVDPLCDMNVFGHNILSPLYNYFFIILLEQQSFLNMNIAQLCQICKRNLQEKGEKERKICGRFCINIIIT